MPLSPVVLIAPLSESRVGQALRKREFSQTLPFNACNRLILIQRRIEAYSYDDGLSGSGDDFALSRELSEYLSRLEGGKIVEQNVEHLNLLWSVSQKRVDVKTCTTCAGSGDVECQWCNGTGALTIGDMLLCDDQEGCRICPVCRGTGLSKCSTCKGTGKIAPWMKR